MNNSITDRLKTSTPSLLSRAEWPMSKGPWTVSTYEGWDGASVNSSTGCVCEKWEPNSTEERIKNLQANARFIAACNSEPPLVETLWEAYHCLQSNKESETFNGCYVNEYMEEAALRLLTHLDAMSVLRWTPKEGE